MDRRMPLAPTRQAPSEGLRSASFEVEDEDLCVGGLPGSVILLILDQVPVTSLPNVALASKTMRSFVQNEQLWKWRWDRLGWEPVPGMEDALLDSAPPPLASVVQKSEPSKTVDLLADLDDSTTAHPYADRIQRAFVLLTPFYKSISTSSSTTSSLIFTHPKVSTFVAQCILMRNLAHMASYLVLGLPTRLNDQTVKSKLWNATGYLEMELRSGFQAQDAERMNGKDGAVEEMHHCAHLAWSLRDLHRLLDGTIQISSLPYASAMQKRGGSSVAFAHIAGLTLFHRGIPHNPKQCIKFSHRSDTAFALEPILAFEDHLEKALVEEVALVQRIFPPEQGVELVFFEKLVTELIADYLGELVQDAESQSTFVYLEAFARSFRAMLPLAEMLSNTVPHVPLSEAQTVLGTVWAVHVDEYLSAEHTWLKEMMQLEHALRQHREANAPLPGQSAADKRSFLSKFKDALLTPAVSMPRSSSASTLPRTSSEKMPRASSERLSNEHEGYVGVGQVPDAPDDDPWDGTESPTHSPSRLVPPPPQLVLSSSPRSASPQRPPMSYMLSLDTAIELVNIARLSLQRLEALHLLDPDRIQSASIRVVVDLFAMINQGHIQPGFSKAREEIGTYDFRQHDQERASTAHASEHVGPLLLFFELVQIGDTIQQMMQVFFDRIASPLLGKIDFTNAAVREKRKMENELDEHVAQGMSAGIELLVQHVEHIILTHQGPRDFYPEASAEVDVTEPTPACAQCCATLKTYCDLLASCTDKALLDVFYQEIGFRLYSVLCKHLKRQIISLNGGFQVISDLNAYYAFITTLRQPTLTSIFGALKRVGSLYIVDQPKELAKMVRDATLSGGTMRSEEMYEFLRSRSDFKSIESNIDGELYGIKIMEDCSVM